MDITQENLDRVTEMLNIVVHQVNNTEDQSPQNLAAIAVVFEKIANEGGVVLDSTVSELTRI